MSQNFLQIFPRKDPFDSCLSHDLNTGKGRGKMMKMSLTILYARLGSPPDSENHTRELTSNSLANRGTGHFSVAMTDRQTVSLQFQR